MKNANVTINNATVTDKSFAKLVSAIGSPAALETAAQAAAYQAVNRNGDWLIKLFAAPTLRLKSGKFSAQGKTLRTYIVAHTKGIKISDKGEKLVEFATEVGLREDRPFIPYLDFINAAPKKAAEKAPTALKGAALGKSLDALISKLAHGLTVEDPAQAAQLVKLANALAIQVSDKATKAADAAMPDADALQKTASVKPSARSKAAPKSRAAGNGKMVAKKAAA